MKRWQTRVQTVSSHNDFTFSAVVVLSILTVTSAVDQSLQTDTHIDLMTLTITM